MLKDFLRSIKKRDQNEEKSKLRRLSRIVKKRDGYRCYVTGRKYPSKMLDMHHGFSKRHYPKYMFNMDYLYTVSRTEHRLFHADFMGGFKKKCTPEDMKLYKEMREAGLLMSKSKYVKLMSINSTGNAYDVLLAIVLVVSFSFAAFVYAKCL